MKWIENHIGIVWALLVAWLISFGIVCECMEPSRETTTAVVVLLVIGIALFTIIIRYYKYNPKGREAIRRSEEARLEEERRRRELYEELDRKYKGVDLPDDLLEPIRRDDDVGWIDFNAMN
jgi:hypothetical protein